MNVGQSVQYIAKNTRGPRAAIITAIEDDEHNKVTLLVIMPNAHTFPAYGVTQEPSTKIGHHWRYVPEGETGAVHEVEKSDE